MLLLLFLLLFLSFLVRLLREMTVCFAGMLMECMNSWVYYKKMKELERVSQCVEFNVPLNT